MDVLSAWSQIKIKVPYQLEVMSAILIAMSPSDGLGVFVFLSVLLSSHV
jgi:hypothetical protein